MMPRRGLRKEARNYAQTACMLSQTTDLHTHTHTHTLTHTGGGSIQSARVCPVGPLMMVLTIPAPVGTKVVAVWSRVFWSQTGKIDVAVTLANDEPQ